MKAIRIHSFTETPRREDIPIPDIGQNDVLVRVEATAVNPLDILVASGVARQFFDITMPITLGTDFAGTIERVGANVTQWNIGDRVIAWVDAGSGGGLADFAVAPAHACVQLPESLSAAQGSAIPTAGITAWHALFSCGKLKARETVLIHAAAGGVGSFAVQFAHMAGAHVIATASGSGLTLALGLGADEVIDYRSQDFTSLATNVDMVIDLVGGETQSRSYKVLRTGGRLVSTVMQPNEEEARAHGVIASIFYAKPFATRLDDLVTTIATRNLKVIIDRAVPFDRFDEAWDHQIYGHARGKTVILSQ
ncbi:NADP-dependent oxidoreductase [Pectobacterium brasiliense]|uniref:NADP-dependent oxidoreductase n=1 Tax=Pectobacterium brasiliense TaxID=180957 RepID=UPI0006512DF1|nr:NADP-dependent oxidoreductase [Pectobacterium brasiliense]KMK81217.1 alcohol dehydrogenase zinc-binding domain protein [Pectobacterium brasiliense ICMP 19477]